MGLYERHNYLNKDILYLISNEIIEYDMVSAGLSLCKKYKLLDKDTLRALDSLPKKERNIRIGLIQRKDRVFARALSEAFREGRKLFFEANNLTVDNVLSIKKDAIYTTTYCDHLEFDELVFVPKNQYSSYYYFGKYEFYYNKEGMDVKGIPDDKLELHADYMLGALYDYMHLQETTKRERVITYVKELSHHYKLLNLDIGYYRELNVESLYRLKDNVHQTTFGIENVNDKDVILTNYNYNNYIVPMIQILL